MRQLKKRQNLAYHTADEATEKKKRTNFSKMSFVLVRQKERLQIECQMYLTEPDRHNITFDMKAVSLIQTHTQSH